MKSIALIRGINVGGHKQVAMADLRELLAGLGFADAKSLLQSGNLLFEALSQSPATLEKLLERGAEKRLGLRLDFLVRSPADWKEIIRRNPSPQEAAKDPSHLAVVCLKEAPTKPALAALKNAIVGRETLHALGRELYVYYPDGMGRSKLTHAMIEKKLATRGTARNWNTVVKLMNACGT